MRSDASSPAPPPARRTGSESSCRVARRGPVPLGLPGQRDAQQRPRPALEDLPLQREQQRRGERRGGRPDLLPRLDLQAVVGQQPREPSTFITAPPCRGSVRRGACAAPRGSSAARRAEAKRNRASSSFWRVIGSTPRDLPAHGQPLEEELDRPLPCVLLREDVAAWRPRRTARRVAGVSAPRSTSTESCSSRYSLFGARGRSSRRPFFAIAGDGSVPGRCGTASRPGPREHGRGERVLPGVWRLRLPLDLPDVPHCNAWALQAGDGIVLVDTGMHDRDSMGNLERALEQAGHKLQRHPADRHHPRPHRPLRAGAADRRARRAARSGCIPPEAARRARDPDRLTRRSRSRGRAACRRSRCERWAERRRGTDSGQAGRSTPTRTSSPA